LGLVKTSVIIMKRRHSEDSEEDVSDTETSTEEESLDDTKIDQMVETLSKSIPQGEGSKFTSHYGRF
jgi:hypothetical protein